MGRFGAIRHNEFGTGGTRVPDGSAVDHERPVAAFVEGKAMSIEIDRAVCEARTALDAYHRIVCQRHVAEKRVAVAPTVRDPGVAVRAQRPRAIGTVAGENKVVRKLLVALALRPWDACDELRTLLDDDRIGRRASEHAVIGKKATLCLEDAGLDGHRAVEGRVEIVGDNELAGACLDKVDARAQLSHIGLRCSVRDIDCQRLIRLCQGRTDHEKRNYGKNLMFHGSIIP